MIKVNGVAMAWRGSAFAAEPRIRVCGGTPFTLVVAAEDVLVASTSLRRGRGSSCFGRKKTAVAARLV